jgi:alkanesulfonate monooxygenase SsuD/methylene tetrahydromethanopterin reductase-like flavin-dependent oxidoreductase (luciferase family)
MTDDEVTADAVVDEVVIAGSPATVAEKLLAFRDTVGPFGTVLISAMDFEGDNGMMEKRSMELLSREVMPRVQSALGAKAA